MDRRKRSKYPRDFWDELFGENFDEFVHMRKNIEKMFQESFGSSKDDNETRKPFVYGFSVRMGPDGIPHFRQFGNTNIGRRFRTGKDGESEREPLTDVIDSDDHVAITMELPGVEKDDISMEIFDDSLIINVETKSRKYHKELKLPESLDTGSVKANCKNGVLEIIIKHKKEKPKKGKKINID